MGNSALFPACVWVPAGLDLPLKGRARPVESDQVFPGQSAGGGSSCCWVLGSTSQSTCISGLRTASRSASQAGQCAASR